VDGVRVQLAQTSSLGSSRSCIRPDRSIRVVDTGIVCLFGSGGFSQVTAFPRIAAMHKRAVGDASRPGLRA
jgi:hypothetical protein